jgi:hypothetical protein
MASFVVITIFKNESTNLKEWVDHYLWQGASHLYMCDNDSTDNPLSILQPYIDKGLITYWIDKDHAKYHNYKRHIKLEIIQCVVAAIQNDALLKPDWTLIADLDEFWYCDTDILSNELAKIPQTIKIISVPWRIFGPSASGEHPSSLRKELIERKPNETSPKYIFRTMLIHYFDIEDHYIRCKLEPSETLWNPNSIHMNHYVLQSFWYFTNIKIPRGCAAGDMTIYTIDYWLREVEGHTLLDRGLADQVEKSENKPT